MILKILRKHLETKDQREKEITKRELEVCVSRNPMAQDLLKELLRMHNDNDNTKSKTKTLPVSKSF